MTLVDAHMNRRMVLHTFAGERAVGCIRKKRSSETWNSNNALLRDTIFESSATSWCVIEDVHLQ